MALFQHILEFKQAALARWRDRRKAARFPVAAGFPLRATLALTDPADPGPTGSRFPGGRTWSGTVKNISSLGLNVLLPPTASLKRGDHARLTLHFDNHELHLTGVIAHARTVPLGVQGGLSVQLVTPHERKAYLQLLEAIAIGANFALVKSPRRDRHPRELQADHYISGRDARLTTWRDFAGQLDSFELVMRDHAVRGEVNRTATEIFSRNSKDAERAWSAPQLGRSDGIADEEVRQLFRGVALNLPRPIPADVREMLRFFATPRPEASAPPAARKPRAPAREGAGRF